MSNLSSLLFSFEEMADITGGVWLNLKDDLVLNEFIHIESQINKDDMFVVHYANWYNKTASNENRIFEAIENGASSLMVQKQTNLENVSVPVLIVEDTLLALKKLALYSSEKSKAKRVVITGSFGKTGFKFHLYSLLKDRKETYARLNSSNRVASTLSNLASLKKNTKIHLIEIPIGTGDKTQRRASYVKPNICVITSIGHEHIEKHGTIENIVKQKCSIAKSLPKGGKIIVPSDDKYSKFILEELKKYKDIVVLSFGKKDSCNAQLLNAYFKDNKWQVIARIEMDIVQYEVPFIDEHAPLGSISELLCAKHLGFDIYDCANEYLKCKNFKSSGKLYRLKYNDKEIMLYDQSSRGGIEGYKSFFKTIKRLKFKENSRKVLLTSEFVDIKDNEHKLLNINEFRKLISEANIDEIYTTENFTVHENVIEDKTKHKGDYKDVEVLISNFIGKIKDGDIICIKGIFESEINLLTKRIINRSEVLPRYFTKELKPRLLKDCKILTLSDSADYKKSIANLELTPWVYYFPLLYNFSRGRSKKLLIQRNKNSISLFLLRNLNKGVRPSLQMYSFVLPFDLEDFKKSAKIVSEFNNYKKVSILWCDENNIKELEKYKQLNDYLKFEFREEEFIYDSNKYLDLRGSKYRNIRQHINYMNRLDDIKVVPYEKKYLNDAILLYDYWKKMQSSKYESINDESYTKNALLNYDKFSREDISGIVILVDGKLKSFGLYGKINENLGNLFVAKSDHSIKGLQTFLKYKILLAFDGLTVNDAGGTSSKGLYESKRMMRANHMLKVYKAKYIVK